MGGAGISGPPWRTAADSSVFVVMVRACLRAWGAEGGGAAGAGWAHPQERGRQGPGGWVVGGGWGEGGRG